MAGGPQMRGLQAAARRGAMCHGRGLDLNSVMDRANLAGAGRQHCVPIGRALLPGNGGDEAECSRACFAGPRVPAIDDYRLPTCSRPCTTFAPWTGPPQGGAAHARVFNSALLRSTVSWPAEWASS